MKKALLSTLLFVLSGTLAHAGPQFLNIEGQLFEDASGITPVESSSVVFTLEILSPAPSECILYKESQTLNMLNSQGYFSLKLGTGTQSGANYEDVNPMVDAFDNSIGSVTPTSCVVGPSYNPSVNDGRQLRLSYNSGSGLQTLTQNIQFGSTAFALSAGSIDGLLSSDLLTINNGGSYVLTQANLEWIFANGARYAELQALLNGTSSQYASSSPSASVDMNSQKIINVAAPTLAGDATNKQYVDGNIGGRTSDSATLGALSVGQAGNVMVWNGTQWTASAPVGDSTKLPLAGGTMIGALNMGANAITSSGPVTAASLSANNIAIYNGANYKGFQAPVGAPNILWTLPSADGTSGQVLQTDGSGVLSFVSMPAASVASASNQNAGGVGVYRQLTGTDLEFRGVNAASSKVSVVLDAANNEIDVDVNEANFNLGLIPNTPAGMIAAPNAQAAINELDSEKLAKAGDIMTGALTMNAQNSVRFADGDSSNYVGFSAPPVVGADLVWILPAVDGLNGHVLQTDGSGNLSFVAPSGGGGVSGASNVNVAGADIFKQDNAGVLEFNGLNDDGNGKIIVTQDVINNEIDLSVNEANLDAAAIPNLPSGSIASSNIQAAINELDSEKLDSSRSITSGNGLVGGGDLSANRTIDVGAGPGIQVNVDNIEVNIPSVADFASSVNNADTILMYDTSATAMVEIQRSAFVLSESEVDAYVSNNGYLNEDGSVALTANWDVGGAYTITNLPVPIAGSDAVRKDYVDAAISGISSDDLHDADDNTGIQVEESANDDTIRFDTAGAERMVITPTGSIGVGTLVPSVKLDIAGTIKVGDGGETCTLGANGGMIRYFGANLQYCNGSSWQTLGVSGSGIMSLGGQTGTAQSFAVNSVGTAPALNSSADIHTLSIPLANGSGVTSGTISKTDFDIFSAKLDSVVGSPLPASYLWVGDGGGSAQPVLMSGDISMSNSGAVTILNNMVNSNKIADNTIVDADINSVASINTTKLGTGVVDNTEFSYLNGVTSNLQTQMDGKAMQGGNSYGMLMSIGTNDYNDLSFKTNNSTQMTITATGYLGVGIVTPNSTLDINGATTLRGMSSPPISPVGQGRIYFDSTMNRFRISENGGAYIDLVSAGNFMANGSVPMTGQLRAFGGTNLAPGITFDGDTDTGIFRPMADDIAFSNAGSETLRINASGYVGIGTDAPSAKLDVNGIVRVGGVLRLGSVMSPETSCSSFSAGDITRDGSGQLLRCDGGSWLWKKLSPNPHQTLADDPDLSFDFAPSRSLRTTQSCASFTLNNLAEEGEYRLFVMGTTSNLCSFTIYGGMGTNQYSTISFDKSKTGLHGATTASQKRLYTFKVINTGGATPDVFITWEDY